LIDVFFMYLRSKFQAQNVSFVYGQLTKQRDWLDYNPIDILYTK